MKLEGTIIVIYYYKTTFHIINNILIILFATGNFMYLWHMCEGRRATLQSGFSPTLLGF